MMVVRYGASTMRSAERNEQAADRLHRSRSCGPFRLLALMLYSAWNVSHPGVCEAISGTRYSESSKLRKAATEGWQRGVLGYLT
jgi:hypothetical protein